MPWYEFRMIFKAIDDKDAALVIDPAVKAVHDAASVDGVLLRELKDPRDRDVCGELSPDNTFACELDPDHELIYHRDGLVTWNAWPRNWTETRDE